MPRAMNFYNLNLNSRSQILGNSRTKTSIFIKILVFSYAFLFPKKKHAFNRKSNNKIICEEIFKYLV